MVVVRERVGVISRLGWAADMTDLGNGEAFLTSLSFSLKFAPAAVQSINPSDVRLPMGASVLVLVVPEK